MNHLFQKSPIISKTTLFLISLALLFLLFELGKFHVKDYNDDFFHDLENSGSLGEYISDTPLTNLQSLIKAILCFSVMGMVLILLVTVLLEKRMPRRMFYWMVIVSTLMVALISIPSPLLNVPFMSYANGPLPLVVLFLMLLFDVLLISTIIHPLSTSRHHAKIHL